MAKGFIQRRMSHRHARFLSIIAFLLLYVATGCGAPRGEAEIHHGSTDSSTPMDEDCKAAIRAVRFAYVTTPMGRSSAPVKNVVAYFDSVYPNDSRASQSIAWRAEHTTAGYFMVSLDYWNAGKRDTAEWRYYSGPGVVEPANHLAEILSFMPPN